MANFKLIELKQRASDLFQLGVKPRHETEVTRDPLVNDLLSMGGGRHSSSSWTPLQCLILVV